MTRQLRIDDIGASSKLYNQYSWFKLANIGPLKRFWPFKSWGPYKELTVDDWEQLIPLFKKLEIRPIIAITACWVEKDGTLTPFSKKFPEIAACLKNAAQNGFITIANHGLTHCVLGHHYARFWGANRVFHREFWPWLPAEIHQTHIQRSQEILETYFGPITIFVPPGNVWSIKTYQALRSTSIKTIIANRYMPDSTAPLSDIEYVDDRNNFIVLHDRDIIGKGIPRFAQQLASMTSST